MSTVRKIMLFCAALSAGCSPPRAPATTEGAGADATAPVRLTWLSVTNWLVEAGDTRILLDGYVTRIDRSIVNADGTSTAFVAPDRAELARVADVLLPDRRLDWILVGHGHWDHAFDTPRWAEHTGARVGGARTVCYQVVALGMDAERCRALEGGEVIEAGPVRVRVVRWHHSGDSATANGRRLRAPLELSAPPVPDRESGGLRPGYLEDYPSGGGSRAYLIVVRAEPRPITLFWSNTGNAQAWDVPVPADSFRLAQDGVDLSHLEWAAGIQAPRAALADALREEGLTRVDVWLGFPGIEHVSQVAAVLQPRVFIPQHWDDFWQPLVNGARRPGFSADAVVDALAATGVRVVAPENYFDRFLVSADGVTAAGDGGLRARLGVRD